MNSDDLSLKLTRRETRPHWEDGFARPSNQGRRTATLTVPVGVSIFPREIIRPSRRWCEPFYQDLRFFEQPAAFVAQGRQEFRTMR